MKREALVALLSHLFARCSDGDDLCTDFITAYMLVHGEVLS